MSRTWMALATALLLLCGNALLAGEPIEAILVVPDLRILPGVPFDFWVELHNRSEDVRRVSVCAPFQMRLVSGEPIQWTETSDQRTPRSDISWSHHGEQAVVQPGETAFLAIPAYGGGTSGGFFRDRRLSAPGRRFAVALPLCEQIIGAYGSPGEISKLMTTEVEIEIVNPTGRDAAVWNLIQKTSKLEWTAADTGSPNARAMWKSVLRDFPDSNYVPYAILMTDSFSNDWRDSLARELRAIQRFSDSPVLEWLHVEAWQTARALRLHGVMLAEGAIIRKSKRPTTRLLAFGNEPH